jgi:hypothetical protein
LRGASVEASIDGRVTRWTGDVEPDGIAYVGRVDVGDAVDVEVALTHPVTGRVLNRYPLLALRTG